MEKGYLCTLEENLSEYMCDELEAAAELMDSECESEQYNEADTNGRSRLERRKQTFKHKARDKNLIDHKNRFVCPIWEKKAGNGTYICRKHSSQRERFFKRVSNKRWRKVAHDVITNTPAEYRKVFDYAWEVI